MNKVSVFFKQSCMTNFIYYIAGAGYIPERQQLYFNGTKLDFDNKSIDHYGIKAGITVHMHDLGDMVPLRICKFIVYAGPPIMLSFIRNYHMEE